jgi:hypothetical protein
MLVAFLLATLISWCTPGTRGESNAGGLAFAAFVISLLAFGFTVWSYAQKAKEARAMTFLAFQRALIEPDLARGRDVLGKANVSKDRFKRMRDSNKTQRREDWELAGRAMAALDVLAHHAELDLVNKSVVLDEWGHVLRRLADGFDAYRGSRKDGAIIWRHLRALGEGTS